MRLSKSDKQIVEEWRDLFTLFKKIADMKVLNKTELKKLGKVFAGNMCQYYGGCPEENMKIDDEIEKIIERYKK